MANFIRIKGGEAAKAKRDILVNADGVLEVRKNAVAYRMNVVYDLALTNTNTAAAEIQFPNTYTVTDADIAACQAAIEESCQNPSAIPYFESSDGTMPVYAYGQTVTKTA